MSPRSNFGFPSAAADVQAAAEYLVQVTHGERDVIQATLAGGQLQEKDIVMTAELGTAQEERASRVAV